MRDIATIQLMDNQSQEECVAIIRVVGDSIGLCISLISDGDVEIFMRKDDCEQVIKALQQAVSSITAE